MIKGIVQLIISQILTFGIQYNIAQQIESYLKLAHPHNCLCPLSTQSLTSCTPNPLECGGTGGCYGSLAQLGFLHVNFMGLER